MKSLLPLFVILASLTAIQVTAQHDIMLHQLSQAENNSVFIQQIGQENSVMVQQSMAHSALDIRQNGVGNSTNLTSIKVDLEQKIEQNGNYNEISAIYTQSDLPIQSLIEQNGDDLNLVKEGVNRQTHNMIVRMQGKDKTLVIRAFK